MTRQLLRGAFLNNWTNTLTNWRIELTNTSGNSWTRGFGPETNGQSWINHIYSLLIRFLSLFSYLGKRWIWSLIFSWMHHSSFIVESRLFIIFISSWISCYSKNIYAKINFRVFLSFLSMVFVILVKTWLIESDYYFCFVRERTC
jgi:hypothetical protein